MFKEGNKAFTITIIVLIVLSLGALGAFLAIANNNDNNNNAGGEPVEQITFSSDRVNIENLTVTVGNQDAPVELTIYEDFGCPHCQTFEEDNRATLQEYVKGDDVKVSYKIVSFMDNSYPDRYPSRAANFMFAVSQHAPEQWFTIHNQLYEAIPQDSVDDSYFITLAEEAGVEGEALGKIEDEISKELYAEVVSESSRRAVDEDGIQGTPSVWVDGVEVGTEDFEAAIDSALE